MTNRAESAPPGRGREDFTPPDRPQPKKSAQPKGYPPLTPRTSRKDETEKKPRNKIVKRSLRRDELAKRSSIAMSRTETILVSASGDVCVCRCRRSSTPYLDISTQDALDAWTNLIPCCDTDCMSMGQVEGPWSPVFDKLHKEEQVVRERSQGSDVSTYEWEDKDDSKTHRKGLLGGAMHKPMCDVNHTEQAEQDLRKDQQSQQIRQEQDQITSDDVRSDVGVYDCGILPLPSFDYSHFHAGHNDMVPPSDGNPLSLPAGRRKKQSHLPNIPEGSEEKKADEHAVQSVFEVPQFVHGVPMFLSTLSQIRITKVSAHPLGAHVLLISAEALLFTYGLNNHGQLGIGIKSHVKDSNRGFITTPTIITPLLENGGKAINCAAGMDHSLVVVSTEGRRLNNIKSRPGVAHADNGAPAIARVTSSPSRLHIEKDDDDDDDCIGNGHTNSPSPAKDESVQHHQLYGFGSNDFMKIGLVSATSPDGGEGPVTDVLLPRRVALHCTVWPEKSSSNVKSLPPQGIFEVKASVEHSAALVRRATGDVETYFWGNATLGALGMPLHPDSESQTENKANDDGISRSIPKCFPHPTVLDALSYRPNQDSAMGHPTEISLGPYCSFVVMSTGRCMSFGFSAEGMLGQGFGITHTMIPNEIFLPPKGGTTNGIVSISAGAHHTIALAEDGCAYSWGINSNDRLGLGNEEDFVKVGNNPADLGEEMAVVEWAPQPIEVGEDVSPGVPTDLNRVVHVCAGYDSSILVVRSGQVLACGKRSGRLGLGEVEVDVSTPRPMFGGFRLFYSDFISGSEPSAQNRSKRKPHGVNGTSKASP